MILGHIKCFRLQRHLPTICLHTHEVRKLPPTTLLASTRYYHHPRHRTMSSLSHSKSGPLSIGTTIRGHSGETYSVQEVLAERRNPFLCVYRASAGNKNFILKDVIPGVFEYQKYLQKPLVSYPNLRTLVDTIPDLELLVYDFLTSDLLQISQKPLLEGTKKDILREALTGLADLHGRGIIHTDIKPNNILLNYQEAGSDSLAIQNIQISDLEDSVRLTPGKNLKGCLCGNQLWRSPESWARARQNTPSDIYSFGVVIIYVMLNDMVFRASDEELRADDAWKHILRRHISYFADEDGFKGLLQHIGEENPFFERLITLAIAVRPREPFIMWQYVDAELRDLVTKMTNLDPARRITAQEALEHPWFTKLT